MASLEVGSTPVARAAPVRAPEPVNLASTPVARTASVLAQVQSPVMSPARRAANLASTPILHAGMLEKKRRTGLRAGSYHPAFYILNEAHELERQQLSPKGVVKRAVFRVQREPAKVGPCSLQVTLCATSSSAAAAADDDGDEISTGEIELKAASRAERDDWVRALRAVMKSPGEYAAAADAAADAAAVAAADAAADACSSLRVAYCKRSQRVVATRQPFAAGVSGWICAAEYEDSICFVLSDGVTAELRCSTIRALAAAAAATGGGAAGGAAAGKEESVALALEPKGAHRVLSALLSSSDDSGSAGPAAPSAASAASLRKPALLAAAEALSVFAAAVVLVGRAFFAALAASLGNAGAAVACPLAALVCVCVYRAQRALCWVAVGGALGALVAERIGLSFVPHAACVELDALASALSAAAAECARGVRAAVAARAEAEGLLLPVLGAALSAALAAALGVCSSSSSKQRLAAAKAEAADNAAAAAAARAVTRAAATRTRFTLRALAVQQRAPSEAASEGGAGGSASGSGSGSAAVTDALLDAACAVPPGFAPAPEASGAALDPECSPLTSREARAAREVLAEYFSSARESHLASFCAQHRGTFSESDATSDQDPPFTRDERRRSTDAIAAILRESGGFRVALEEGAAASDGGRTEPLTPRSSVLDARILTTFLRGWDPTPPWEETKPASAPLKRQHARAVWIQNCADGLRREALYRTSAHIDLRSILDRRIGPPDDLFARVQACWTSRVYGTDDEGHTIFCERACEIDLQGLLAIETRWPGAVLRARAQFMEAAFRLRQQSSLARKKVRFRSILIADLKGLQVGQLLKAQIRDLVTDCMNLGNHYPCSLHKQYIVNTPWAFRVAFDKLIRPRLWPATAAKICLMGDPKQSRTQFESDGVGMDALPSVMGGAHPGRAMVDVVGEMIAAAAAKDSGAAAEKILR